MIRGRGELNCLLLNTLWPTSAGIHDTRGTGTAMLSRGEASGRSAFGKRSGQGRSTGEGGFVMGQQQPSFCWLPFRGNRHRASTNTRVEALVRRSQQLTEFVRFAR
jgi:hypothetical protein